MSSIKWDGGKDLTISAKLKYDHIIDQTAMRCANHLIATSPVGIRRSKHYKYGWTVKKGRKQNNEYYVEVWNKTDWQLTHLLENGHQITNKKGGVGWASAKPHIQMAVDFVEPQFINEMKKAELDIEIK